MMLQRLKAWLCRKVGHSFSAIDLLMFHLECGRCYTVNMVIGEGKPYIRTPQITCPRCGEHFTAEK